MKDKKSEFFSNIINTSIFEVFKMIFLVILKSFSFLKYLIPNIYIILTVTTIGLLINWGVFISVKRINNFKRSKILLNVFFSLVLLSLMISFIFIVGILTYPFIDDKIKISDNNNFYYLCKSIIISFQFFISFLISCYIIFINIFNNRYNKKITSPCAYTSTCIVFENMDSKINTYLVYNKSYSSNNLMFPGGHINVDDSNIPEDIAIQKAKDEAGLEVKLISKNSQKIGNCHSLSPPNMSYFFELNDSVKCFNDSGHKFHIDNVFIAELIKESDIQANYERIKISLEKDKILKNDKYISENISNKIREYANNKSTTERKNFLDYGEFVCHMLKDALVIYLDYLNEKR